MPDNTIQKIEKSEERLYGPPCILVCGYRADEQESILSLFASCGLFRHPVVFVAEDDSDTLLRELVKQGSGKGRDLSSGLARAIIMSGFTQNELHSLLSSYRKEKFEQQLWATLTPVSEGWTLRELLKELRAEAEAFKRRQVQQGSEKGK